MMIKKNIRRRDMLTKTRTVWCLIMFLGIVVFSGCQTTDSRQIAIMANNQKSAEETAIAFLTAVSAGEVATAKQYLLTEEDIATLPEEMQEYWQIYLPTMHATLDWLIKNFPEDFIPAGARLQADPAPPRVTMVKVNDKESTEELPVALYEIDGTFYVFFPEGLIVR